MKKFLSWMLIASMALVAVSCDDDDDDVPPVSSEYIGDLIVGKGIPVMEFSMPNIKVTTEVKDDAVTVNMFDVKFASQMPYTINLVIPNVPKEADGDDYEITNIVPTMGGIPATDYTMSNVSVEFDDKTIEVEFTCKGLAAEYTGTIK